MAGGGSHRTSLVTKKERVPVQLVPEGTEGSSVVAIKRVNELSFYSLGHKQVANMAGLSGPRTSAVIWRHNLKDNDDFYKEIQIGGLRIGRYSPKAVNAIKAILQQANIEEIWQEYQSR